MNNKKEKIYKDVKYNKKEMINNYFELQLDSNYVTDLIIEINDKKYIKECIENREKLGLGSSCIVRLINAMEDANYIKECVKKRNQLRLASYHICKIIKFTNDIKYIKECVNNRKELCLSPYYLAELIEYTNDKEYIIYCIEHSKKLKLDSYITAKLIGFLNNEEYLKKSIKCAQKIGLNKEDITYLIKKIKDKEYIKKYIEQGIIQTLNSKNIVDLIIHIENKNYIEQCIKNKKKLGLELGDVINLILLTQNRKNVDKYIQSKLNNISNFELVLNKKSNLSKHKNIINLPEIMTIGIEIEMVGLYSDRLKDLSIYLENWQVKEDDTVKGDVSGEKGIEIVSPVLTGSNKKNTEEILRILNLLKIIGQHINDSCGGHIHIGCNYLKNTRAYVNLLEIWGNAEYILYIIANKEGTIPRGIVYASPISKILEENVNKGNINVNSSINCVKKQIVKLQGTRAKGINFSNILSKDKETIEFRLSNGTMEADVWIQNINLYGGIIKVAQLLSEIQEKDKTKRNEYESELLENFENLKLEKNNKKKLEYLLNILIEDETQRKIYRNRYNTNIQLLQYEKKLNNLIKSKITVKNIKII